MEISFGDVLSIAAIIIAIYTSTVVVKNRTQKDFMISQAADLKNEYRDFIMQILNEQVNAETIRDSLCYFGCRIKSLFEIISKEYKWRNKGDLNVAHSNLHWELTGLGSINEQYETENVHFNTEERAVILNYFEKVDKAFLKMVVDINDSQSLNPWDKEDDLGY